MDRHYVAFEIFKAMVAGLYADSQVENVNFPAVSNAAYDAARAFIAEARSRGAPW